MHWTTLTLTELWAATKADIIRNVGQYITAHFTKRQIIVWLLDRDRIPDRTVVTHDDQGEVVRMVKVWRDPKTGERLGGTVITWDYFATGEVRFIIISDRDGNNTETRRRRIRHWRDNRQPVMEEVAVSVPSLQGEEEWH